MQEILCLLLKHADALLLVNLLRFTDLSLGSTSIVFAFFFLPFQANKLIYSFELFHFV